jgi:hypothetical protein
MHSTDVSKKKFKENLQSLLKSKAKLNIDIRSLFTSDVILKKVMPY